MSRRRKAPIPKPPDWVESFEITANGRHVVPGTELKIRGERGRFRFLKHVSRPALGVEWVDVWGGPRHHEQLRSFRPDRIRTVHRISNTEKALLAVRTAAKREERVAA